MASLFDDPFEFEDDAPSQHVRQSAIPNPPQPAIPLTVSELTADIRAVLESGIGQVWVEGPRQPELALDEPEFEQK